MRPLRCNQLVKRLIKFTSDYRKWLSLYSKVKLGYNEQLGTGRICLLEPGFVITGLIYVVKWHFGQKKSFVITVLDDLEITRLWFTWSRWTSASVWWPCPRPSTTPAWSLASWPWSSWESSPFIACIFWFVNKYFKSCWINLIFFLSYMISIYSYRVCHRFRLTTRVAYFQVNFDPV